MVLNPYIITYLVCAFISALIGVVASLMGFAVWRRWNLSSASEEQYRLEKIVYLIITILSLGFFLRLLNVPLWFWTLHSMIV
jgi:H+/Cl- antiporter ClcA